MHIALLTEPRYESPKTQTEYIANLLKEDRILAKALADRGVTCHRIAWSRPDVDWGKFDAGVFRTTWDYFERLPAFLSWLERAPLPLINPVETILWNLDKRYLLDLDRRGIPIVPTHLVERGGERDLVKLLDRLGWTDAIIKPTVSAAAHETWRVTPQTSTRWPELIETQAMLIQPFQTSIVEHGEFTLMLMDGRYTHGVLKRARAGDFRVQDDHGGTVHPWTPDAEEIAFAEAAMKACEKEAVYGRVDLVRDDAGKLRVMEIELVEPELWFRFHPPAAQALANALVTKLT